MIRRIIILLLIVGCVFGNVISVTGFRNNTSNSEVDWIGESIADNITSDLVRISSLNIVNRKDLKKILQEQKFQHSGLVDLEKSVEIGEMAGATKLIAGDYSVVSGELRINVNYLDVESGITEKSISKSGKLKDLFYIQNLLVLDLLKALNIGASELEEMKISQLETEDFDAIENNYKGVLAVDNQKIKEAIEYFEKAVIIDPYYKNADKNLKNAQKIRVQGKSLFQNIMNQKDIAKQQNIALKKIGKNFKEGDFMILSIDSYEIDKVKIEDNYALLTIKVRIDYNEDAFRDLHEQLRSIAVDKSYLGNLKDEDMKQYGELLLSDEIIEIYKFPKDELFIARGSSSSRNKKFYNDMRDSFKLKKTLKIKSSKRTIRSEKLQFSVRCCPASTAAMRGDKRWYSKIVFNIYDDPMIEFNNHNHLRYSTHIVTTLKFKLSLKKINQITSIEIE